MPTHFAVQSSLSLMSTPTASLPYNVLLDIFHIVLDELIDLDQRTHRVTNSKSFVSHPILAFCQKQLLRRYKIKEIDGWKCYLILLHSPYLIAYVKEIWVYLGRRHLSNLSMAKTEIIRSLAYVHHLGVVVENELSQWFYLHLIVRQTILDLLQRPQITSFSLRGATSVSFPLLDT